MYWIYKKEVWHGRASCIVIAVVNMNADTVSSCLFP